jgi:hypothetical protein
MRAAGCTRASAQVRASECRDYLSVPFRSPIHKDPSAEATSQSVTVGPTSGDFVALIARRGN